MIRDDQRSPGKAAGAGRGTVAASPAFAAWNDVRARSLLARLFEAAVDAARPATMIERHLPSKPNGRCVVVGAGKAAGAMAAAVEAAWPDVDVSGAVVVPYGHAVSTSRIKVLEAAHPVPDAGSIVAARTMIDLVTGLSPHDQVLALVSGGGSALLALPADGLTLDDKQTVNRALLASGLDIRTMNRVRRRLSGIKGGKLAMAAAPARVVTLVISDIPGDDVAAIASGPTIPAGDDDEDLSHIAEGLRSVISDAAYQRLLDRSSVQVRMPPPDVRLVAAPSTSLAAAAEVARRAGVTPIILGDDLEGESVASAQFHIDQVSHVRERPVILLSGGETTVTLQGQTAGRGGRNSEFALALAIALRGSCGIWAFAGDTDGEDGASGGAAGAIVTPDTLERGNSTGLDASRLLAAHDSGTFFSKLGDAVVTGPTHTNVNDFRAILLT